jgi:RNA-directed DNA polymerase
MFSFFLKLYENGRSLDELKKFFSGSQDLTLWLGGTPQGFSYTKFEIPKKSGGVRILNAPNDSLKKLQRKIHYSFLKSLKPHSSCRGFAQGQSIVTNALPHVGQAVVINLDLKDFFNTVTDKKVYNFFRAIGWGRSASKVLTNICCYQGTLPQGAPTSPALSNLVNYRFDVRLSNLVKKFGGIYTRYADDITLSFPKFDTKHKIILKYVSQIIRSEGFQIQKKKRIRIQRSHQRQTVTGLIVNQKVNLPRFLRRRIRAMEHQLSLGKIPKYRQTSILGYIALRNMLSKQSSKT